MAPVLLDYTDNDSAQELAVSFVKCQFVVSQTVPEFWCSTLVALPVNRQLFPFTVQCLLWRTGEWCTHCWKRYSESFDAPELHLCGQRHAFQQHSGMSLLSLSVDALPFSSSFILLTFYHVSFVTTTASSNQFLGGNKWTNRCSQ